MDVRETLYLSPLRSWLRKAQGIRLYSMLRNRQGAPAAPEADHFPGTPGEPYPVPVHCDDVRAEMLAIDAGEYRRFNTFPEEVPLIGALLRHLRPGDRYWDIGASFGLYSLLIAQRVGATGQVVAFEPERESFARLQGNVDHNQLTEVVVPCNLALGRERAELALTVAGNPASGAHGLAGLDAVIGDIASDHQMVTVLPGDEFRSERDFAVPTAMKIDVEGAELDVVTGLASTLDSTELRAVLVEVHFATLDAAGRSGDPKKIVRAMQAHGFTRRVWIDKSHVLFER